MSEVTDIRPSAAGERSKNPLRPDRLDDVIGQLPARKLLNRAIDSAYARKEPLPHTLFVGPPGTGKTTLAQATANELGVSVYQLEAPVSVEQLLELREVMWGGDILFIDEIHMQASQDRRGSQSSMSPEVFYNVLEDRTIVSDGEVLPFARITVIGATTDEGMLPDPFLARFPLPARSELRIPYSPL